MTNREKELRDDLARLHAKEGILERELEEISKERKRKAGIKRYYTLGQPEKETSFDESRAWEFMKMHSDKDLENVNYDAILELAKAHATIEILPNASNIFRCPDCGEVGYMHAAGYTEDTWSDTRYTIACRKCDYEYSPPKDYRRDRRDAWEAFENMLWKKGYLKEERGDDVPSYRPD